MFIDSRELASDVVLHADVCIVGAGPAGISLARELDGRRYNVVVLESGGLGLDAALQPLGQPGDYHIEHTVPARSKPLRGRRQFAGNSNAWSVRTGLSSNGVRLTRLSDIDFKKRDWVGDCGWPFGVAELASHYERAQRVFQLDPGAYAPEDWEDSESSRLPVPGGDIDTAVFQFGNGDVFRKTYRRMLAQSRNIRVFHHATVLEVETDAAGGTVTGVRAASNPGREFRVEAKSVVLAGGGMTCAQLLLASNRVQPNGLGNGGDLVGRYYMDHPIVQGGRFVPTSRELFRKMTFYDLRILRGVPVMGHLQLSDAALERERLFQLSMMLFPRKNSGAERSAADVRREDALRAVARMRIAVTNGRRPSAGDLAPALKGIDGIALRVVSSNHSPASHIGKGGWSRGLTDDHAYDAFEIIHQVEQPPHWNNRVYLSDKRDALGCRKIAIDWRWHAEDIATMMRAQDLYAAALSKAGLGTFEIFRPDGLPLMRSLSTSHYMGMTRMHADPRRGVVNEHCEVHGVRNLFVASCSVFPTGGFANPTLTIVALALRIGDQIKQRLGGAAETNAEADAETAAWRSQRWRSVAGIPISWLIGG